MRNLILSVVGAGAGALAGCALAKPQLTGAMAKCKETLPGKGGSVACEVFFVGLPAGVGAFAMVSLFGR